MGGVIVLNSRWFLVSFIVIPILLIVILLKKNIMLVNYIQFVEFLFDNRTHNFRLLPMERMYLHNRGMINQINISNAEVTYIITPSKDNIGDKLLGDEEIRYKFSIRNRKLPQTFKFIVGNDYSNEKMEVWYKLSENSEYTRIEEKTSERAPYWKGTLKCIDIALERNNLPQGEIVYLYIKVICKKAFELREIKRDTIICLPILFANNVERITYYIDAQGFNEKMYFSAKRVHKEKRKYLIDTGSSCRKGDAMFSVEIDPNEISGEQAYYFRIGTSEIDPEES